MPPPSTARSPPCPSSPTERPAPGAGGARSHRTQRSGSGPLRAPSATGGDAAPRPPPRARGPLPACLPDPPQVLLIRLPREPPGLVGGAEAGDPLVDGLRLPGGRHRGCRGGGLRLPPQLPEVRLVRLPGQPAGLEGRPGPRNLVVSG